MRSITLEDVGTTGDLRIDPHHFHLKGSVSDFIDNFDGGASLAWPWLTEVRNGENLSASLYIQDDTLADALYASVGALSQFALRESSCVRLKADGGLTEEAIDALCARPDEVWITRSGTPGIAWAPIARPQNLVDTRIIPSGFLIRMSCNRAFFEPGYVAAILNHPVWRIWSSSLAAGKRQRNLSQEHLAAMRLPMLPLSTQSTIQDDYLSTSQEISSELEREQLLNAVCDEILAARTGLHAPSVDRSFGLVEGITLDQVGESVTLRIDHRNLRGDLRTIHAFVLDQIGSPLAALVKQVVRNSQPTILPIDEQEAPRIIATGSIQFGSVQFGATKQGISDEATTIEDRQARCGDLLVAMDGEGSIGKVAVFDGDYEAVCDSHVAILRLHNPSHAYALACFLNSSMGQAQIYRFVSGATGQLQLAMNDLLSLWVPDAIYSHAEDLGRTYLDALATFEGMVTKVRKLMCTLSANVSRHLVASRSLPTPASNFLDRYQNADDLMALLGTLKSKMF